MERHYFIALCFGVLAAVLMGLNSVFVRFLTTDMHGLQIAVVRLWVACGVIYMLLRFKGHKLQLFPYDRYQCLAIFGFTLNYITFHIGLEKTSATNAMVIENTAPFFVLLFLVFAGLERVRWTDGLAIVMALCGVYLTVRHDFDLDTSNRTGDLLELGAGVSWALFIVGSAAAVKKTQTTLDRMAVLLKILLPCAVVLTPTFLFYPLSVTAVDVSVLLALGVFSTALGYYFWYEAMATVSTVMASLLVVLSVVFTFVAAFFVLDEQVTLDMLAGAALIIAAVILPGLANAVSAKRDRQET